MKLRHVLSIAFVALVMVACGDKPQKSGSTEYTNLILDNMKKMKVGDWAVYYMDRNDYLRMLVVERDSTGVTIDYHLYLDFSRRQTSVIHRFDYEKVKRNLRNGYDLHGKIKFLEMKSIVEPSKLVDEVVDDSEHWAMRTNGAFLEQWFHDKAPIWGIVRQRLDSKNTLLLRGYGRAGEKVEWPPELPRIAPATKPIGKK